MEYPPAVLEKAQRLAQLLQRVAAGEPLEAVNTALGFNLAPDQVSQLQAKYDAGGRTWGALLDGRHGHPRTAHSALREWLYARKEADAAVRAPQLVTEVQAQFGVKLSAGHINYLLRKRGLTAPPGRPYTAPESAPETSETAPAASAPVDNAGLFFPGSREGRAGGGRSGRSHRPGGA